MTVAAEHETVAPTECWCCGSGYAETELVRLGNHPEVAICMGCAQWVRRRARRRRDGNRKSPAARARRLIDSARDAVIRRGWHDRGLLGTLLRRIDRHLP